MPSSVSARAQRERLDAIEAATYHRARSALERVDVYLQDGTTQEHIRGLGWLRSALERVLAMGLEGEAVASGMQAFDALLGGEWVDPMQEHVVKGAFRALLGAMNDGRPEAFPVEVAMFWLIAKRPEVRGECQRCHYELPAETPNKWDKNAPAPSWPWDRCPVCDSHEMTR